MKEHTALHMVEIQYLKGKLAFEDTLDQFVEFQHKKYQMRLWDEEIGIDHVVEIVLEDTLDQFVEFQHKKYQMIIRMKK